jgi:peptidoglycan/xylan/chitin deacetylase (PgdA/CDA1 family)
MHAGGTAAMIVALTAALFLLSTVLLLCRPPATVIRYLQRRWPDVVWEKVDESERIVALTIDDGPSEYTEEIIDVLCANDATATFFVIGSYFEGRERVLQRLLSNGNELGNHTLYDEPSWKLPEDELLFQIRTVDEQIALAYNSSGCPRPSRYFRPGSGFFTMRMREMIRDLGYKFVLGGIYPHDAQIASSRLNAWHILSLVRPGSIIICHDGRPWTAPMLRRVLPTLKKRGYRIGSLSRLLDRGNF